MSRDLTFAQQYEIDVSIAFSDRPITMRYFECGSHQIEAVGQIDLPEARRLHRHLANLPGIKKRSGKVISRGELGRALSTREADPLVNGVAPLLDILCTQLGIEAD